MKTIPSLELDQTAVWKIALGPECELAERHSQYLTTSELRLSERLKRPRKRQHFIVTRSILRQLIGHYRNLPAHEIVIDRNRHGKPFCHGIEFNISHSRDWALIALSRKNRVGVDVQHMKPNLDFGRIARRRYTNRENEQIEAECEPSLRRDLFFAIWTRKEAYVKAHGTSFYDKISSLNLPLGRDQFNDEKLGGYWQLNTFKFRNDYWATICAEHSLGRIALLDW